MTSGTQAAAGVASAASYSYSLGPAENALGAFGYDSTSGTPGTLGPVTTLKGATIITLRADNLSADLALVIQGVRAQAFWRMIMVLETSGTWRRYLSANATYSTATNTLWSFGTGSNRVWTASTPTPRGVIIFV